MICKDCKHIIVLNAFSEGKCKICGERIVTPHIPCYKVCKQCSEKLNLCKQCGKEIVDEKYL